MREKQRDLKVGNFSCEKEEGEEKERWVSDVDEITIKYMEKFDNLR